MFKRLRLLLNNPLSPKQKQLLTELQDYYIIESVQSDYRNKLKNNQYDTYETIKNKLIRNIILGHEIKRFNDGCKIVQYGNLEIFYDPKNKEIYKIKNCEGRYVYNADIQVKNWLDNYLKIKQEVA